MIRRFKEWRLRRKARKQLKNGKFQLWLEKIENDRDWDELSEIP